MDVPPPPSYPPPHEVLKAPQFSVADNPVYNRELAELYNAYSGYNLAMQHAALEFSQAPGETYEEARAKAQQKESRKRKEALQIFQRHALGLGPNDELPAELTPEQLKTIGDKQKTAQGIRYNDPRLEAKMSTLHDGVFPDGAKLLTDTMVPKENGNDGHNRVVTYTSGGDIHKMVITEAQYQAHSHGWQDLKGTVTKFTQDKSGRPKQVSSPFDISHEPHHGTIDASKSNFTDFTKTQLKAIASTYSVSPEEMVPTNPKARHAVRAVQLSWANNATQAAFGMVDGIDQGYNKNSFGYPWRETQYFKSRHPKLWDLGRAKVKADQVDRQRAERHQPPKQAQKLEQQKQRAVARQNQQVRKAGYTPRDRDR